MPDPDYYGDQCAYDDVEAWNEFLAFAELNEQEPVDG